MNEKILQKIELTNKSIILFSEIIDYEYSELIIFHKIENKLFFKLANFVFYFMLFLLPIITQILFIINFNKLPDISPMISAFPLLFTISF